MPDDTTTSGDIEIESVDGANSETPTSAISIATTKVLEEATATLLEDVINGRQYGFDEEAHEENVAELKAAHDDLRGARQTAEKHTDAD
jgi:hypothetical protein